MADGEIPLKNGIQSRLQGYSVIDDSASPLVDDDETIKPRKEKGIDLYFFGYGLSYTTFAVSAPKLNGNEVSVTVTNTGKVRGDDVVQMYLRDLIFTMARPRYELKGFRRVTLEPGETKTVTFALTEKELGYWNRNHDYVVEPGDFRIWVTDSFQERLEKRVPSVVYTAAPAASAGNVR